MTIHQSYTIPHYIYIIISDHVNLVNMCLAILYLHYQFLFLFDIAIVLICNDSILI